MRLPAYQELSKEQDQIITLPLEESFLVAGPPGTGKTVLALQRASMMTNEAAPAEVIMYSRLLSNYVGQAVDDLGLSGKVSTYHRWLYNFWNRLYGCALPQVDKYSPDWTAILTRINKEPPQRASLPFMIIDEGQDLPPNFFHVARYMTRYLTIYADENQMLTDTNSTLEEIRRNAGITTPTVTLVKNYRNTREIARVAACFYTGLSTGMPTLPERQGDLPKVLQFSARSACIDYIARFERNNNDLTIGVFVQKESTQRKFHKELGRKTQHPVRLYSHRQANPDVGFDEPGVILVNYRSAKGLEFDAVFLPELQALSGDPSGADIRMMFYVLTSRARDYLFLTYLGEELPGVIDNIDSHNYELVRFLSAK